MNERKHRIFLSAILMIAVLSITPVFGQEPASVETEAERSRVYMKIGTVTVTEEDPYIKSADLPTSVDVLGADQIENENVDFGMELFKKLPGTYYGDWNQGIVSGTFSIRGFDANHDVPAALIVDGIPHNWARGSMDIQPFFPMEIERIVLVKGTNDPRYGLNNIAGNANVYTKRGGNDSQVRLLYGSFQTSEGNILVAREKDGFSQTYFAGYRRTDGYRDHSDLDKGAVSGKWFYTTSDGRLTVGGIARFFDMDADAPGYLTKEQYKDDPQQAQSFSKSDGGDQENRHGSLHLAYSFSENLNWSLKTYAQHLERHRWCRFSESGSQQERIRDEDQYGAISTVNYETADLGIKNLRLAWGVDYQYQDNISQRYRTLNRDRQGSPTRDWDYTTWYVGSYVEADGEVTDWLRLIAAMRVDYLDGHFEDKVEDRRLDMLDYGEIWQPKIGAVVTPVPGYNLYANWGRTFQIGAESMRFGERSNGDLFDDRDVDYSKNDGWEAGIKVSPVKWLAARLSYWEQDAKDEVRLVPDPTGESLTVYDNVGETDRYGWDLVLSVKPHEWVTMWGSYTRQKGEYTEPGPGKEAIKGNDIENIPDYTLKAGVDFEHPCGFSCTLWLESQDDYYVEPDNTESRVGEYEVVNLDIRYKIKLMTFAFQVRNLFDEEYSAFSYYSGGWTKYSPGDERSFYGSIMVEF
ncbi:MAG: hypothetical protein BA865_03995 [Desulfobacterales bacterium S5133MH4]|nr:MAG: hypothetical protein BA865_03995 [Desulfobacterales bacterium S5133MH4]